MSVVVTVALSAIITVMGAEGISRKDSTWKKFTNQLAERNKSGFCKP